MIEQRVLAHIQSLYCAEDKVLSDLLADLAARGPQIQVGADEGRLLHLLVAATGATRVLEVGTLFGYSGIWMARALPADGHLDTIEFSDLHADAAEHWFAEAGLTDRVTVHRGAALDVLPRLEGPYDIAFLDAVKGEYQAYLDHCLRLVRRGGLILGDNALWRGEVADASAQDESTQALRAYGERIASDPRLLSTIVPVSDGLAISLVR